MQISFILPSDDTANKCCSSWVFLSCFPVQMSNRCKMTIQITSLDFWEIDQNEVFIIKTRTNICQCAQKNQLFPLNEVVIPHWQIFDKM